MKVLIDDHKQGGRKVVEVEFVRDNGRSVTVKLPNGDVINRRKGRDIPQDVQ